MQLNLAHWSAAGGALNLTHCHCHRLNDGADPPFARRLAAAAATRQMADGTRHDATLPRKEPFLGEDKNSGKSVAQSRNELLTQGINFVV